MSSYAGLDEQELRKLLDSSSDITERRKIRAALREVRSNNNNTTSPSHHPHIRATPSRSKLSHHQSLRYERRRRPEIVDDGDAASLKKRSQDDDILYRSRRRREMEAGGRGGGGGGGEGDEENQETAVDIDAQIKEAGLDEQKLTKLLSETRDFNDRRKVRSAIREVKKKGRQQDDTEILSRRQRTNHSADTNNSLPSRGQPTNGSADSTNSLPSRRQPTNHSTDTNNSHPLEKQPTNHSTDTNNSHPLDKEPTNLSTDINNSHTLDKEPTNHNADTNSPHVSTSVQQENHTNLSLSRSSSLSSATSEGQRSKGQEVTKSSADEGSQDAPVAADLGTSNGTSDHGTSNGDDGSVGEGIVEAGHQDDGAVEREIEALQKQLESADTFEERRRLRTDIRILRQKQNGCAVVAAVDESHLNRLSVELPGNFEKGDLPVRSKVNDRAECVEGQRDGGDQSHLGARQQLNVENSDEENPYAIVNRFEGSGDANDNLLGENQSHVASSPAQSSNKDFDFGYAEPEVYITVAEEGQSGNVGSDIKGDLDNGGVNGRGNKQDIVDIVGDTTCSVDSYAGSGVTCNTSQGKACENMESDYEIISPAPLPTNKTRHFNLTSSSEEESSSVHSSGEEKRDSPELIKTLTPMSVKEQSSFFEEKERKYENRMEKERKIVEEKEEEEVARNLLPSEIKKKQMGLKGVRPGFGKPEPRIPPKVTYTPPRVTHTPPRVTHTPPKVTHTPPPPASAPVDNPQVEVVHRPAGSRRARIIRSFLELERIKKEGVNRADGRPIQINAPTSLMTGAGMKGVSGAGGGLRGSDAMLEDMINLQLMQAMGINPHAIASPNNNSTTTAEDIAQPKPQRPSHLPLSSPIKTNKPVKQPGTGPSHGIAKMLNRFGENTSSSPKPAFHGGVPSKAKSGAPFGKGLKKAPMKNAFQIDVKGGEVEISMKEDNRRLLMNKLASQPRGKGKGKFD